MLCLVVSSRSWMNEGMGRRGLTPAVWGFRILTEKDKGLSAVVGNFFNHWLPPDAQSKLQLPKAHIWQLRELCVFFWKKKGCPPFPIRSTPPVRTMFFSVSSEVVSVRFKRAENVNNCLSLWFRECWNLSSENRWHFYADRFLLNFLPPGVVIFFFPLTIILNLVNNIWQKFSY